MIELPKHKASLSITHNQHKSYYESVEDTYPDERYGDSWVSEEQKQKAIDSQDVWELHWYPETPIGFHVLLGADLDVVLKASLCNEP